VFEEGTFVPVARITDKQQLSIVTNYLGTPEAMYREDGEAVWTCELNSYGKVRNFHGEFKTDCPFRYQGQYEDSETGLFYNRFRYYSAEEGVYLSQDPTRLRGGCILYGFVCNVNSFVDIFGLETLATLLADHPELLEETRKTHKKSPEWWGIDPDKTDVFYRPKEEVDIIRAKPGESGGHHPHGLALGGPEGQVLTSTGETRKIKNKKHSQVTGLQRRVINVIKKKKTVNSCP
jgi:RHS repeat-associated protein